MACDCLTKSMPEDFLQKILDTNVWNVAQTEDAKAIKLRKNAGVQRRKAERAGGDAPTLSGHTEDDDAETHECSAISVLAMHPSCRGTSGCPIEEYFSMATLTALEDINHHAMLHSGMSRHQDWQD